MASNFAPKPISAGPQRWRWLSSEPHRLMFCFGAVQALAAMLWWLGDVSGRYLALHSPTSWSLPPMWAHAWLLLYGLFPFFMLGFLMTAGPNWLGAGKMPRSAFLPAGLAMAAGLVLFYSGLATGRALAAAGVVLHLAGWMWGIATLVRLAVRHWNHNARYAIAIFMFVCVGLAGDAAFALAVASGDFTYVHVSLFGAVWCFLAPVYFGVATRMVPFFSGRVLGASVEYRPSWARPVLIAGTLAHGAIELTGSERWLWLVDLPLAAIVLHLAFKWGLARSFGIRLLAVLHISLAVLAFALFVSGGLSLAVWAGALLRIGLAPIHLVVIGYFSSMLIGMVSRVSLGHSGRALEADTLTWLCFFGVIASALTRAAAEFVPQPALGAFMIGAALLWLAAFGAWAWRYVPMYLAPRVDAS
jgi:uncharacterized protein involved in response to NO